LSKHPYDRFENIAIEAILALFGTSFEVAIKLEDCGVVGILSMGGENSMQANEDAFLPVDESTVAVKSENFESAEVKHG
jgi:hypothetical protein